MDAEDLAECGIKHAYEKLGSALRKYNPSPAVIHEEIDNEAPRYRVTCLGSEYVIYEVNDSDEAWGRATFALFDIVNRQLTSAPCRFFAINSGNDLGGMFLTPDQAEAAKKSLPRTRDWPYVPMLKPPWYGQYH